METLIKLMQEIANESFDGHWTILSFTTNYRVGFGTPFDLYEGDKPKPFTSLEEALTYAIKYKPTFDVQS